MTSKKHKLFGIIKFGKKEHITELQEKGMVFMRRLSNYIEIEHKEIGDKNEGLTHLLQASQIKCFSINSETVDVVKNIKIKTSNTYNPFVFCSYALDENSFDDNHNNIIDKENLDFGDTALLIADINTFYERIEKVLQIKDKLKSNLIEYIDEDSFHGKMGILKKIDTYKHQKEHRIIIERDTKDDELKFNIGSIQDISKIYSSKNLLNTMSLEIDDKYEKPLVAGI